MTRTAIRYTDAERAVLEQYGKGMTLKEIAATLQHHPSVIRGWLVGLGIYQIRYRAHHSREDFTEREIEILSSYAQGVTGAEMAEQLDCGESSVYKWLDVLGIKRVDGVRREERPKAIYCVRCGLIMKHTTPNGECYACKADRVYITMMKAANVNRKPVYAIELPDITLERVGAI